MLEDTAQQDMVLFILVFVCSGHYIHNPYLVAKLVEVCIMMCIDRLALSIPLFAIRSGYHTVYMEAKLGMKATDNWDP